MRLEIMLTAGLLGMAAATIHTNNSLPVKSEKFEIKHCVIARRDDEEYVVDEREQKKEIFPKPKYNNRNNSLRGYASRALSRYR